MNFVLDNIIFALQRAGGISVYWYELLKRMKRDMCSIRVIEHPRAELNIFRKKLDFNSASIIDERTLPLCLSRYLPYPVVKGARFIYHSSYYRQPQLASAINIVTVYDFTYERFRHGVPRLVHSMQKKAAVRAASGIICISENTKRDLLKFCPEISSDIVRVIYLGVSENFRPLKPAEKRPLIPNFPEVPFIIFIGSRDSYKNFHLAVESVAVLPTYWLVSIGGGKLKPDEVELLQRFIPGRHIHLSVVDGECLNQLYNCAHALLYPSSYEGFGIPILEAMASGCPVIAANVSAIPEACGDAGLLVNEISSEMFADKILKLENAEFRSKIINKGYVQARRFSWETCYRETLSFYEKVMKENAARG